MPRSMIQTLGVLVLLVSSAGGVEAQTDGSIRGEVVDSDGAPLPGATITATSEARGNSRTVVSGDSGTFALTTLPVDTYTVEATLAGFHPRSVAGVRVGISSTVNLRFEMVLETVVETIVVSAAPLLDSSSSSVGTSYAAEFIEEMPTTRNFWDMMAVAPGISPQSEQSTAMSAFGSGITSNSWNIDGLNTTNADTGEAFWWISPDIVEEVQVLAIGAPAQYGNMSGAALNVVTKSGTNDFKGGVNLYYQDDSLTDDNAEINGIPFRRDKFDEYTLSLGGPIQRERLWFFVAHQNYRRAYTEAGENPDFPADDRSENYDIKVNSQLTDSTSLEVKWHYEDWEFASADPNSTPDASGANFGTNPAYGVRLDSVLNSKNLLEASYAGYTATQRWLSKTRSTADPYFDKAPPDGSGAWQFSGSLWYPYIWDIERDQVNVTLSTHADELLSGDHEFTFGIEYGTGLGDTITAGGLNGVYYYRNEYSYEYYGYIYTLPYYYRVTARAYHYGAETDTISAFIDDSWKVTDNLTLNLGLRFDSISSDIPDYPLLDMTWSPTGETIPGIKDIVEWEHFSPRIGFAYTIDDSSVLRGFYGKFYDGNVMGNWYAPPPDAPTYDYEFSASLDGPWTHFYTFEWGDYPIDPDLKPPETDQFTLGYERRIGKDFALGVQGIYKETKNLIGWEILDDGVYELVPWTNPFTGEVENLISILEQPTSRKGNRPGDGSLAPGQRFEQDYKGAFVSLRKIFTGGWGMQASYTWSDSNGFLPKPTSQVQGDPFYTGTDGRDPNNWLNAEQALQNEREHVLQFQGTFDMPAGFTGSVMYRFLSGKPFNRQLTVGNRGSSSALAQGSQTVIAVPADTSTSMSDQNIVDLGLSRDFPLGETILQLNLRLYNALNEDSHDWWDTLNVPPDRQYVPSGYIWPRRLMVHLRLGF